MPLWIPITIAAALLQNARSALQVGLRERLGPAGATYVRFLYAVPIAAVFAATAFWVDGAAPDPTPRFAGWIIVGAAAQIFATAALLTAVAGAGFALATTLSKTEPLLAAAAGALLLSEAPPPVGLAGVVIGVIGVALASAPSAKASAKASGRSITLGVASAALFGLAAVAYRAASLSLDGGSTAARAGAALLAATLIQTVAMGLWLAARRPDELRATLRAWRPGLAVGCAGGAASIGWFTAMTLEPAAHVRALAQVELLFAAATAWIWFGERPTMRGMMGMALVAIGAALLLAAVG